MNPDKTHEFRLGSISAPDELAELWAIDKRHGEASSKSKRLTNYTATGGNEKVAHALAIEP